MHAYCPAGHRVSYEAVKPSTCPNCHAAMETASIAALVAALPPATVAVAAVQPWAPATAPAPSRGRVQVSEYTFDRASLRVTTGGGRRATVGDVANGETDAVVERTSSSASAATDETLGEESASTSDLISGMLEEKVAPVPPAPVVRKVAAKSGGAKRRAAKGGASIAGGEK